MSKRKSLLLVDHKLHYKMYKQGKHWLFAAIFVAGLGAGATQVSHVQAATSEPSTDTSTQTDAKTTGGKEYILSVPQSSVTKGPQSNVNAKTVTLKKTTTSASPAATTKQADSTATATNKPAASTAPTAAKAAPTAATTAASKTVTPDSATTRATASTTTSTATSAQATANKQTDAKPAAAKTDTIPTNLPKDAKVTKQADGTLLVTVPEDEVAATKAAFAAYTGKVQINVSLGEENDVLKPTRFNNGDFENQFKIQNGADGSKNSATFTTDQNGKTVAVLTPATNDQSGNLTLGTKINIDSDFDFTGAINLGSDQNGADGISFGFHTDGASFDIGHEGGSLGFAGLENAFGWKADTYWDPDPTRDIDIGYFDSDPQGYSGKAFGQPVYTQQQSDGKWKVLGSDADGNPDAQEITKPNDEWNNVHIHYSGTDKKLEITYTDDLGEHTWTQDVSAAIAKSSTDGMSFFIAGATGGYNNKQQVRMDSLSYAPVGTVQISYIDDISGAEIPNTRQQITSDAQLDPLNVKNDGAFNTTNQRLLNQHYVLETDPKAIKNNIGTDDQYDAKSALGWSKVTLYDPNSGNVSFGKTAGVIYVHYTHDTKTNTDTITKTISYVDQQTGATLIPDFTEQVSLSKTTDLVTGDTNYAPENATLAGKVNPSIAGYHVVAPDAQATSEQTVKFGAGDVNCKVVYAPDKKQDVTDVVNKTIQYVDQNGNTLLPNYTEQTELHKTVDLDTGATLDLNPATASLAGRENPNIAGYHIVSSDPAATATQTVQYGDPDIFAKVIYAKDTFKTTHNTINKTVSYVDQRDNHLADNFTDQVTLSRTIDADTGMPVASPDSETGNLGFQKLPVIPGYHVVFSDPDATSKQTVNFDSQDITAKVIYAPDTIKTAHTEINKTISYVDQRGNHLADDFTDQVTLSRTIDDYTGKPVAGLDPEAGVLGYQDLPIIPGYHVVFSDPDATSKQSVNFDSQDITAKVIYAPDTIKTAHTEINKTISYVDQNGNHLAPDFTDKVALSRTIDDYTGKPVAGVDPEAGILGYQDLPIIAGYHVVFIDPDATSKQTVNFGSQDINVKVVYAQDAYSTFTDTVNKTISYVDDQGNHLAPDFTDAVQFAKTIDEATGKTTALTPESGSLGSQKLPVIKGYHIVAVTPGATSAQTVKFGDQDIVAKVVYAPDPVTKSASDPIHKTVHYVDEYGNTIAPDYTDSLTINQFTDTKTGELVYSTITDNKTGEPILGHQADPFISGYTLVTSPAAATTDQTVAFGDKDIEVTVVYTSNAAQPLEVTDYTATKVVHYVDENGKTVAPDFTFTITFTKTIDPANNTIVYSQNRDVFGYKPDPEIPGYHIKTSPAEATSVQSAHYGDQDRAYTVVYAVNPSTDTNVPVPPTDPNVPPVGKNQTPPAPNWPNLPDTFVPNVPNTPNELRIPKQPNEPNLPDTFGPKTGTPENLTLPDTYGSNNSKQVNLAAKAASAATMKDAAAASKQLPQTGEQKQPGLIAAGLALLMSMLGMVGLRKREH